MKPWPKIKEAWQYMQASQEPRLNCRPKTVFLFSLLASLVFLPFAITATIQIGHILPQMPKVGLPLQKETGDPFMLIPFALFSIIGFTALSMFLHFGAAALAAAQIMRQQNKAARKADGS